MTEEQNQNDTTETQQECTGCTLTVSVNGGAAAPVTGGAAAVPYNFVEAVGGATLAALMFTFDGLAGECNQTDCTPKKPCKVRNPHVSLAAAVGGTLTVTCIHGPVSPPSQIFAPYGGQHIIEPVTGVGGLGGHTEDNPYDIPLVCGGTSMSWRFRYECLDPSLGTTNAQEVTITVTCTACSPS